MHNWQVMHKNQKTGTERALRNSSATSEAKDLMVSRPSKDQDIVRT